MTDDRRMTTDRFFGGVDERLATLQATYEFVNDTQPTEEDLHDWLVANTSADSATTIDRYLSFQRSVDLLHRTDDRYALTDHAEQFLTSADPTVLFETLQANVAGFGTMLAAIAGGERTADAIQARLQEAFPDYSLTAGVVARHIEWCRVCELVTRTDDEYVLTATGHEIVAELDVDVTPTVDSSNDNRDLGDLRERAEAASSEADAVGTYERTVAAYNRSETVREYALARADGHCEGCGEPAPFLDRDAAPYLQVHHIHELSEGGPDTPETVIALCPNCHYRVHHGRDGEAFNRELAHRLAELEAVEVESILDMSE
jgi:5-methylcytosine-specific restriction endonuclease McrA